MRQTLSTVWVVAALVGAAASAAPLPHGDAYISYSGTASAPRTQKFLYGEQHVLAYREGKPAERVVLYTCLDGSPFARKTVSYVDELAPDFALSDASNGMHEGVRTAGATREAFFRGADGSQEKSGALPHVPGLVADAGFDEFVREHWQPLMSGQTLTLPFWVPSRQQDIEFRVLHLRGEQVQGAAVEVFRLKLSGLLGSILPSIDVTYGSKDRVLQRYVGFSDLRNAANDNFQAEIAFRPEDRKEGSEHALEQALTAQLAPCK